MRRVILGSILSLSLLSAGGTTLIKAKDDTLTLAKKDVTVVKPYFGYIKYDSDSTKSIKDSGMLGGIYISNGTLDHLYEFDVGYTNIKYKSATALSDIQQLDMTLAYSKFYTNYMFKGGVHYINSTDVALGNGIVFIGAVGGYKWKGYDKYSYGLEAYYTLYSDGHDDTGASASINIFQFTPYFSYSKAINLNTRNNFDIRVNQIIANEYNTKSYTSVQITDSILYKKFIFTAKVSLGEMKTGILDSGHTAYNTKDIIKGSYALKMGYIIKPNMSVDVGYTINTIQEDRLASDGTNSVITASLNYSF